MSNQQANSLTVPPRTPHNSNEINFLRQTLGQIRSGNVDRAQIAIEKRIQTHGK